MNSEQISQIERSCVELPESTAFSPKAMLKMVAELRRTRLLASALLGLLRFAGVPTIYEAAQAKAKAVLES